jgi:2-oxoglutarate dehydrogenase E1 component
MAMLIHGDAAFAGEGIVQETLNLSQLPGYEVGGTLHVVVNNQIGFTTPPEEARSCGYATDVAKMLQIPIFHVNGEDPEAVAQVSTWRWTSAASSARRGDRHVLLPPLGAQRGRRAGLHPAAAVRGDRAAPTVREGYLEHLLGKLGEITRRDRIEIATSAALRDLEQELGAARDDEFVPHTGTLESMWRQLPGRAGGVLCRGRRHGVDRASSSRRTWSAWPSARRLPRPPQAARLLDQRRQMAVGEQPLDWATAEALALATLAARATACGSAARTPARHLQPSPRRPARRAGRRAVSTALAAPRRPGECRDLNSPLSEAGVLGFEYGYSLVFPDGLVMWEAQFGDFVNAAQVIIDQFIASAEDKWRILSGLVLLLAARLRGQGPEHSSARLERFLWPWPPRTTCRSCNPTTPAQYFHVLRRQVLRRWRKPLVVMTPKSMLARTCTSCVSNSSTPCPPP